MRSVTLERLEAVDSARGIAIAMMVVYHVMFDLDFLNLAAIPLYELPIVLFQRSIGTLFILLAGISITLSESRNTGGYAHHFRRGVVLGIVALCITAATWIYPHDGFITFGIIHFIALSTFIAPFVLKLGRLNVLLGLALVFAGLFPAALHTDSHFLFWLGFTYPGYTALDFYPMIPWFGVMLLGIYSGQALFPGGKPAIRLPASGPLADALALLGRNSLTIYLAHQPVIVGAMLAFKALSG